MKRSASAFAGVVPLRLRVESAPYFKAEGACRETAATPPRILAALCGPRLAGLRRTRLVLHGQREVGGGHALEKLGLFP